MTRNANTEWNLHKGLILEGIINPRCDYDRQDLPNHEIILYKDTVTGRPQARDKIVLIDIDGERYPHKCTKADTSKRTTVGQPSEINRWFRKYYAATDIRKGDDRHRVFLEYTDVGVEFKIYTSEQWNERKVRNYG